MIQALIIGITINICEHLTVDRGIAQTDDYLWLEVLIAIVIRVEGIFELFRHSIVVSFRH
jgi:hypothetical protein